MYLIIKQKIIILNDESIETSPLMNLPKAIYYKMSKNLLKLESITLEQTCKQAFSIYH